MNSEYENPLFCLMLLGQDFCVWLSGLLIALSSYVMYVVVFSRACSHQQSLLQVLTWSCEPSQCYECILKLSSAGLKSEIKLILGNSHIKHSNSRLFK